MKQSDATPEVRRLLGAQLLSAAAIALALVAILAAGVLAYLFVVVVPHFERIFADMGVSLPPVTRFVIDFGQTMGKLPPLALCLFVVPGLALWLGCLWRVRAAGIVSLVLSLLTIAAVPVVWLSLLEPLMRIVETVGSGG